MEYTLELRSLIYGELLKLGVHYGPRHFTRTFYVMLFADFIKKNSLSHADVAQLVRKAITQRRIAPRIQEFRELLVEHREDARRASRTREAGEAAEFWSGRHFQDGYGGGDSLSAVEKREICAEIRKRLLGRTSDSDWAQFMELLAGLGKARTS